MDRVRAYFDRYARLGQTRTARQLEEFCRQNGIRFDPQRLRRIRHEFKYAAFAQAYRRPLKYMASSVSKYGVVHLDMANFQPQHRAKNDGCAAFLCAVECLSGQLVAVPCRDLTTASWRVAVQKLAETTVIHALRVVVSDRDAAVKSDNDGGLRALLKRRYGISWIFLKNRSKAFKSERMIRFLKERLSMALRANEDGQWVHLLDGICRQYNASFIPGTKIRRSQVDQHNYLRLLEQLYRSPEPTMRFIMAETFRYPSRLARFLWDYKVGDKVLVARRSDHSLKDRHTFEKPSVVGSFGPTVYRVTACLTKKNWKLFITPVYTVARLSDGTPLSGKYYPDELAPADFAGRRARRLEGRLRQQHQAAETKKQRSRR